MKTNLLKYLSVIIFLTLTSCSDVVKEDLIQIKGYDEETLVNGEGLHIKSFDIIRLEETDNSVINSIRRVEMIDTLIIVQTEDKLLSFNRSGKFICQYGEIGNGPSEYIGVRSYVINRQNETIKIIDQASSKIITFDIKGIYLSNKRYSREFIGIWTHSGVYIDNENILFNCLVRSDMNSIYTLLNLEKEQKDVLYNFPVRTTGGGEYIGHSTISRYKDEISLIIPFDNVLYGLKDGKIVPRMSIPTIKPIVKNEQLEIINDFSILTYANFMDDDYFTGFTGMFETDEYILLDELFASNYFLVNKTSNRGRLYTYKVEKHLETLPLIKIIGCSDSYFIGTGEPFRLMELKDKLSVNTTDKNLLKLKGYIDTVSLDSNPCLFLYQLN